MRSYSEEFKTTLSERLKTTNKNVERKLAVKLVCEKARGKNFTILDLDRPTLKILSVDELCPSSLIAVIFNADTDTIVALQELYGYTDVDIGLNNPNGLYGRMMRAIEAELGEKAYIS